MRKTLATVLLAACTTARPAPETAAATTATAAPVSPRALQTWANGAVFYEVFVRSFQDSNADGKGDLKGLISRLDYLNDGNPSTTNDLGVDALWLMPVFDSPSYHGYDTTNYEKINPDYGTGADFDELLQQAHKRGMKVIVDLVMNHTGVDHPWFVESASSPTSPKRDWYVWSPKKLDWGQPWNPSGQTWHEKNGAYYYGLFWAGMPDLNFRNPAVREEMKRIAALWLKRGVDGFRLDAIRHLIETGPGETGQNDTAETHAFLEEFAAYVRSVKPDAALVGEAWTETPIIAKYYGDTAKVPGGDQIPLDFDFPLAGRIVAAARQGEASLAASKLEEVRKTYPEGATDVPFLTNHDQKRVASSLNDPAKLRTAAAILLTLPGAPFIYYGEEVGLLNGPSNADEDKRTPMPWDGSSGGGFTTSTPWHPFAPGHDTTNVATQTTDPASLLSRYRNLIHARHASQALSRGSISLLLKEGPVLSWLSTAGSERVLVVHNLTDAAQQAAVPGVEGAAGEILFTDPGAALRIADHTATASLPPHASVAVRVK